MVTTTYGQTYHIWPRAYDPRDWKAGSIIACEGKDCQWCAARWETVYRVFRKEN